MGERGEHANGRPSWREISRRDALKVGIGGGLGAAGLKSLDNAVLGYGVLVGTNLLKQDLGPLVAEGLAPSPFATRLEGTRIEFTGEGFLVDSEDWSRRLVSAETSAEDAAEVDARFGLSSGPLEELVTDLGAIADGEVAFEFTGYRAFFDRLAGVETRPFTVEAVRDRRWMGADPATVERFAGVAPADPGAVVTGLADAFREHTYYDAPRYLAGSVDDNLVPVAADLRAPFRSPTGFEAVMEDEDTGLFCWDFTHRSMEALQAEPAVRQSPPVFGWEVYDGRHGHMYTAIGSAFRTDGGLVLPMTFVDYSRSTWFDHYRLRWLFGGGLNAYDSRHRATWIGREPEAD